MRVIRKPVYECDICKKQYEWIIGQWIAVVYHFGSGYAGWEHEFHVCGNVCDNRLNELGKKLRLKLANEILNKNREL